MENSVFSRSPWLVDNNRFDDIGDQNYIDQVIDDLARKHIFLTLICQEGRGRQYEKSILIKADHNGLLLDKPLEWHSRATSCRIYFRSPDTTWNYFHTNIIQESVYTLTVSRPNIISTLKTRNHRRVEAPLEAWAFFRLSEDTSAECKIIDMSANGMLVCCGKGDNVLQSATQVDEIVISMTAAEGVGTHAEINDRAPMINSGRVVRSFQDSETEALCLGIAFSPNRSIDSLLATMDSSGTAA
ncbi:MAG: hypothetical protein KJ950_14545 [Proteobacteria bacterium]|nr:hypothetical protein [Pseudomonadota bacterium]MBU1688987.1 hypothetical protein [Pseudomonadota bacterium]